MYEAKTRKKVDAKEFELPETHFIRDIEDNVFQAIVCECLAKISGITLVEGNLLDSLLGRENLSGFKGVQIEQNNQSHSVSVKVDVNIQFGVAIPAKAEEIQTKLAETITELTGLHVSCVHVVFKGVTDDKQLKKSLDVHAHQPYAPILNTQEIAERFTDQF